MLCQNETKPLITMLLEEMDEDDLNKAQDSSISLILDKVKIVTWEEDISKDLETL